MAKETHVSFGCAGCLPLVIGLICLWGLLFGVNYDGTHYELKCNNGVTVEKTTVSK